MCWLKAYRLSWLCKGNHEFRFMFAFWFPWPVPGRKMVRALPCSTNVLLLDFQTGHLMFR